MLPILATLMTAAGVALAGAALYAARKRGAATGLSLAAVLTSVAWWGLAYALELSAEDLATKLRWGDAKYLGVTVLPAAWLVFVLQYTGRNRWVNGRLLAALAVEPIAILLLMANPATHDLVRFYRPGAADQELPVVATGPWFWVHFAYANTLLLGATTVFVASMVRLARTYRQMALTLVAAALLPWVANVLHNFEVGWFTRVDLTPFAFTVTGGVLVWGVFRERLVRISPLARRAVVDNLPDGVLVVDAFGRVVDLNQAACRIFGRGRNELVGLPSADLVSPDTLGGLAVTTVRNHAPGSHPHTGSPGAIGPGAVFDVRREALTDSRGRPAGELVVLRDITDRIRAEERLRDLLAEKSRIAAALQASLVPQELPEVPGLQLTTRYEPAGDGAEIGGDFFDVFPLGTDRWGLVLGDVSGKGAEAAAVTALARYTLRTLARPDRPPSRTLRELNTRLLAQTAVERHCTLIYAVAAPGEAGVELQISLAGHHPPLVRRAAGGVEPIGRLGTALGLVERPDLYDTRLVLEPGDLICMFTDGLVEARRGTELFDAERAGATLQQLSLHSIDDVAAALLAAARQFHGQDALADDLAILIGTASPTRELSLQATGPGAVHDSGTTPSRGQA